MSFSPIAGETRFGEVLNPARGRTSDCALPTTTNHSSEITVDGGRGASSRLLSLPTTQLRFAAPAHIAHPHGVPPWHSGEEGVAGAIDRHFRHPQTNRFALNFPGESCGESLVSSVTRAKACKSQAQPAEPLHDGTFRTLAEPSNCTKSLSQRQDFSGNYSQPASPDLPHSGMSTQLGREATMRPLGHSRNPQLFACRSRSLLVFHEHMRLMTAHTRLALHKRISLQLCDLVRMTRFARAQPGLARKVSRRRLAMANRAFHTIRRVRAGLPLLRNLCVARGTRVPSRYQPMVHMRRLLLLSHRRAGCYRQKHKTE